MLATHTIPFILDGRPVVADRALPCTFDELRVVVAGLQRDLEAAQDQIAALTTAVATSAPLTLPRPFAPAAVGTLRVHLLGQFSVKRNGTAAPVSQLGRKPRLLFAYLAVRPMRQVPKDRLLDLFWPDCSPARASNNLSIAVHQLRSWLACYGSGNEAIATTKGMYGLSGDGAWSVDVDEFGACITAARASLREKNEDRACSHLAHAIDLYSGEFLAFDLYEEWTIPIRTSLARDYLEALACLARHCARETNWTGVLDYAGRVAYEDDCDEEAVRHLMCAHWKLGNRTRALGVFRRLEVSLRDEIGAEPSRATQDLFARIHRSDS